MDPKQQLLRRSEAENLPSQAKSCGSVGLFISLTLGCPVFFLAPLRGELVSQYPCLVAGIFLIQLWLKRAGVSNASAEVSCWMQRRLNGSA